VKLMKRLMVVASLALIAGSLMASSAFASGVKWNSTGRMMQMKGTLTLKKNGASPITCSILGGKGEAINREEAGFSVAEYWMPFTSTKCSNGGTWQWSAGGEVNSSASAFYFSEWGIGYFTFPSSPWGGTWAEVTTGAPYLFTNGSGATYSHLDFNETVIGQTSLGQTITATGKVEVYNGNTLTALTVKAA
jgi:hypothetical protein